MKKLILVIAFLIFCSTARADLVISGQGTSTHGTYNLIYDDDINVTWYDFTNTATDTWQNQKNWADTLSVDIEGTTFTDWRLPATVNGQIIPTDITPTSRYNITSSEMGHLYYTELGNLGFEDTNGAFPQPGWGLNNTSPFQNLLDRIYWSGTEFGNNNNAAWDFHFSSGNRDATPSQNNLYALAVHSGDVASVPEPSLELLLSISLIGLVGVGAVRKIKQKKAIANS